MNIDLKVEIKRNKDGKIVTDVWKGWDYSDDWWWSEGNAGCDCNRAIFFNAAQGEETEDEETCSLGDPERFSVRLSNNSTGEILYNEFKE